MLKQSVACAFIGGGAIVVLLSVFGEWLFGLLPEWRMYAPITRLFPVVGATTVLTVVAGCIVTYETAQGRFRFLWYVIPICAIKIVFLYTITGYSFFEGMVPNSWLSFIGGLEPCRLQFVAVVLLLGQLFTTLALLVDVLCVRSIRQIVIR